MRATAAAAHDAVKRIETQPRADWQAKLDALGFDWHTVPSPEDPAGTYWDESAYWQLTSAEVDCLEEATNELHAMSLAAAESAIVRKLLPHFGFGPATISVIEDSWYRRRTLEEYGSIDAPRA